MDFILYEWPNGLRTANICADAISIDVYDREFTPSGVTKVLVGHYDPHTKQFAVTGQFAGMEYVVSQIEECLAIAKEFVGKNC